MVCFHDIRFIVWQMYAIKLNKKMQIVINLMYNLIIFMAVNA